MGRYGKREEREVRGGGGRGVLGKSPELLSCFSCKDPLTCSPQAVDTELLYNLKSFRGLQREES